MAKPDGQGFRPHLGTGMGTVKKQTQISDIKAEFWIPLIYLAPHSSLVSLGPSSEVS